jgi:hypothetical protein
VQITSRRVALIFASLLALLFSQLPRASAQESVPRAVREYAQPGETIQTIPPIHYGDHTYQVYYFVRRSLDDPYGVSLSGNDPDYLDEQGIEALLVTRDDQVITDEDIIRWVYLLARTSYKLHHEWIPDEIASIDEGLVDQVEGLRSNPIFVLAFLEQNIKALFTTRKEEYAEPLRGILTAQAGITDGGNEFTNDLLAFFEISGDAEDALDSTIGLAKYSNDRKLRTLAAKARDVFQGWTQVTEENHSFLDTPQGRIGIGNGLAVLGLGIRMLLLTDFQQDRADWLAIHARHFQQGDPLLDEDQAWAVALVQDEAESDWARRGEMVRDFVRDQAVDLGTELAVDLLAERWVQYAWQVWGKRTTGHLAAGAAYQALLIYSAANLLYGLDDIYNNFTTADRADELRQRFRAGRLELQTMDWPEDPNDYDGEAAEAYRAAYMLEALSAAQVLRSFADGVASSRFIIALANLVSGGMWTEAIEVAREMADQYEASAETELGHPKVIDRAVELTLARLSTLSIPVLDSAVTAAPDFLSLAPGEATELIFEIQNTGSVSWLPGQGYALINTNEESLGASPVQTLASEIPPGNIAQWRIPITAPAQISLHWTEWQMAYDGAPFGDSASCLVAVVPEGDIEAGIDIGALLAQWLEGLKQDIEDRFDQFLQDLADRFEEWLQRESERLLSELLESLSQQCCGAALVAPGAVLLVGWASARRRRRGMGERDRD